jgi:hypothetical protein
MKLKKRLTQGEEFEILKLVIDKVLWIGLGLVVLGVYKLGVDPLALPLQGLALVVAGVLALTIIVALLVKEFEIIR